MTTLEWVCDIDRDTWRRDQPSWDPQRFGSDSVYTAHWIRSQIQIPDPSPRDRVNEIVRDAGISCETAEILDDGDPVRVRCVRPCWPGETHDPLEGLRRLDGVDPIFVRLR